MINFYTYYLSVDVMDQSQVRSELIRYLRKDIIGPGFDKNNNPDNYEILEIQGSPENYYLTGYLSPIKDEFGISQKSGINIPEKEGTSETSIDQEVSENINQPTSIDAGTFLQPSSIGITVFPEVDINGKWEIDMLVEWGRYTQDAESWNRTPYSEKLELSSDDIDFNESKEFSVQDQISIYIARGDKNHSVITIRIVNEMKSEKYSDSESTIFQPIISLTSNTGWGDVRKSDPIRDDKVMKILYSESKILALGHNVGVDWLENKIWTDFMPTYMVKQMSRNKDLDEHIPSMESLCSSDTEAKKSILNLREFIIQYRHWIDNCKIDIRNRIIQGSIPEDLINESERMISEAISNADRMDKGIDFLIDNKNARKAFMLANESIMMSQNEPQHPDISNRKNDDGTFINFKWRPFQLAFQLLNIRGLCALEAEDSGREERDIVDLAWFPTGGGKTEAYLGLIATISFYRRVRFPEKELTPSVHSIMRYTLRLLTADQADRLVRLIGAMNIVARKDNPNHNFPDFRVGMWVGQDVSPNDLLINEDRKDSYELKPSAEGNLEKLRENISEPRGTVIQFEICPWCGTEQDPKKWANNWEVINSGVESRLQGKCPNKECEFHNNIPFSCIDDDLYLHPPTVLLATADKFVQFSKNPWAKSLDNDESSNISRKFNARTMLAFNQDNNNSRPPDLIIQDELHLLTGPLGTLAGLIETAIDTVWDRIGHKPKYVAATATIRGAERDAMLMFGREMNIFPPPVSRATDNFFAQESDDVTKGRIHVGIMGPPMKARTLLNQPAGSLLQRIHEIRLKNPDISDDVFDPYYTFVGYFNSLRELGGAQTAIPNQIANEMMVRYSENNEKRELFNQEELTSRKTSSELKVAKAALNRRLGNEKKPIDTLVTTNMFQVGIDIPRLGLMAIVGQPRSNSEYIQSSGRVGRDTPGLVVSLLRSTFPRDQSHYENFREFHQEIYRNVDRTSTTPFSEGALERGMTTAIAVLFRMYSESLSTRDGINALSKSDNLRIDCQDLITRFQTQISDRENSEIVGTTSTIVNDAIAVSQRIWMNLKTFFRKTEADGKIACWEIYNQGEYNKDMRGWISNLMSGYSEKNGLNSLRDVNPEVRIKEFGHDKKSLTLPEGHLFSHSAPGSVWQKQGISYMTMGVNRWFHGTNNRALRRKNETVDPGLTYDTDHVTNMLGDSRFKLRFLPKEAEHGEVTFAKFPAKYGYRCSEYGHIEDWLEPDENNNMICTRELNNGSKCGSISHPTRWISACKNGHISHFDYWGWVHHKNYGSCNRESKLDLIYLEGSDHTLKSWLVKCTSCGATRTMENVPTTPEDQGPSCRGYMYWLDDSDEKCELKMSHTTVGKTNVTYLDGGSIMLIPLGVSWSLYERSNAIKILCSKQSIADKDYWNTTVNVYKKDLIEILEFPFKVNDEINKEYLYRRCKEYCEIHDSENLINSISTVRKRERAGILDCNPDENIDPESFSCRPVNDIETSQKWLEMPDWPIHKVSRLDKFEALQYIKGLNRLVAAGNEGCGTTQPIDNETIQNTTYGIARMHNGEGLYFEINPLWLEATSSKRESNLSSPHSKMIYSELNGNIKDQLSTLKCPSFEDNNLVNSESQSGNHLTIVHTLSHLLIREICSLSGYSLGSISERLYLEEGDDGSVISAGILIYTSGPSSDGTLGGLVRQGTPKLMENLIRRAISSIKTCSNDPVCHRHTPSPSERNGAACHSCLYLPETSCELNNLYLDRRWS